MMNEQQTNFGLSKYFASLGRADGLLNGSVKHRESEISPHARIPVKISVTGETSSTWTVLFNDETPPSEDAPAWVSASIID